MLMIIDEAGRFVSHLSRSLKTMASDRPSVSDQPERKIEVTLNLAGGELAQDCLCL